MTEADKAYQQGYTRGFQRGREYIMNIFMNLFKKKEKKEEPQVVPHTHPGVTIIHAIDQLNFLLGQDLTACRELLESRVSCKESTLDCPGIVGSYADRHPRLSPMDLINLIFNTPQTGQIALLKDKEGDPAQFVLAKDGKIRMWGHKLMIDPGKKM